MFIDFDVMLELLWLLLVSLWRLFEVVPFFEGQRGLVSGGGVSFGRRRGRFLNTFHTNCDHLFCKIMFFEVRFG